MLVLTRKPGEKVVIGDDIVVTVLEVRGDGVRIGFEAPSGLKIQRDEVLRAVAEANAAAEAAAGTSTEEQLRSLIGSLPAAEPKHPAP